METIFDYGITKEEKEDLACGLPQEKFISLLSQDEHYYMIAIMFYKRDNKKQMMKFVNKLPWKIKNDFERMYISEYD